MTLWNAGGMIFSRTLGMLLGPGAFLLGSRRRASWKIAGARLPMTMFLRAGGLFGIEIEIYPLQKDVRKDIISPVGCNILLVVMVCTGGIK